MGIRDRGFWLALIVLVGLSGCLGPSMETDVKLKEINCTNSMVLVNIRVSGPMTITLFTSEGEKTIEVEKELNYTYLVENERGYERVLVTSNRGHEYQRVLGLPECACLLFDAKGEWDGSNLNIRITAVQDADVSVIMADQTRTLRLVAGENKIVSFPLQITKTSTVNVTVAAVGWCKQEARYSITLEKYNIIGGKAEYFVGKGVKVHKEFDIEGVISTFPFLVGRADNLTISTDGNPAKYERSGNTIVVKEPFKKLSLDYDLAPIPQNSKLQVVDQVMSMDSVAPIPITANFDPAYSPHFLNYTEFSVTGTNPVQLSSSTTSYQKVVNILYGPRKVRIKMDLYPTIVALNDTQVKLEVLMPKNTTLQKIEKIEFSPASSEGREGGGDSYYIYDFNLKKGENVTIHMEVEAIREAGLYPDIAETSLPSGGNDYWKTDNYIDEAARKLVGASTRETVVNVVEFVKNRLTYEDNDERLGAIRTFHTQKGSCDEYSDLTIVMLRELGISAAYVSGYSVEAVGGSPPGGHGWVKVLSGNGVELEPQEGVGAIDPYRVEFYTEYSGEKSRYQVSATNVEDVAFFERVTAQYQIVK